MITYSWRTGFDSEEEREVGEMLAAAASADAEAGFPAVSLSQPYPDDARHLVVRLLPDDRPGHEGSSPVAAYLRIEPGPDGGPATVRYVVRPEFRSRGISTLLVEKIGLDLEASGLRVWARGDHPAAQRMARRFESAGIRTARREWQLLAPLRDSEPPGLSDLVSRLPGGLAERAGPEISRAVWYDPRVHGLRIAVDVEDRVLARACRLLGFRHDRTDIEYTVGPAPAEVT
jgi:mycothiol synthase